MGKLEDRLTNGILDRCDKMQGMVEKQISLAYPTLLRKDIERMVKPLQWEDFYWVNGRYYLEKFRFIQFEENVSGFYDFWVNDIVAIRDVKLKDIPQQTTKFLINLICSALGVEE